MLVRILRNFAILLFILAVISFILYFYNVIDLIYLAVANITIGFIEMILIMISLSRLNFNISSDSAGVLIPKGKIDHKLLIANTNIFQKNISSTNPIKESIFRINVELSERINEPLGFSILRTCETNTCEEKIDSTNCLNEGLNSINIKIRPKEKLNFMFDKDVNVKLFEVEEFYVP